MLWEGNLKRPHRRQFLHLAGGAATLPCVFRIAQAQVLYPNRPVTIIVPFAAGGPTDVTARIVGEHMSRTLGQQFIIENVVGAGGTTGSTRAMRSASDGYTIQMGQTGTHAASVALYPNLAYRPDVDFEPIGLVVVPPILIVARKDFPAKDLKEFMAYARANADKLNMAHAGVGSITHFTCLWLNSMLGIQPTLLPFTGSAPAINALIAGQVDYICDPTPDIVQQLQGRTLKAYAIASPERSSILPDIPTTKEAGLPEFQVTSWYGLFAPKGTPKAILDKLTRALDMALDDETVRKRLLDLGCDIPDKAQRGQQPLATLVQSEIARWVPIIKDANIKIQ
jgi:tripartite-type tricarboxylate transporter receptor subunit TctC